MPPSPAKKQPYKPTPPPHEFTTTSSDVKNANLPPRLIPRGQVPDRHYPIDSTSTQPASSNLNHKPQRPVPIDVSRPVTPNNNIKHADIVERPSSVVFPQILTISPTNSLYAPDSPNVTVVQEGGMVQPYREEEKPFEMSDFYKYSTKFRQKQMTGNNKANG